MELANGKYSSYIGYKVNKSHKKEKCLFEKISSEEKGKFRMWLLWETGVGAGGAGDAEGRKGEREYE